ncbi:PilZ domain-containing protein [Sphingomicrobium flavum]|uniref:PilZ domain-containing protein n=1 Tax=Sphingomicrobium flavum TaxID=1229164 RepID=UPI0021AD8581|nr:PilZ domain-containing protein [Sphingomicrobium flavum]
MNSFRDRIGKPPPPREEVELLPGKSEKVSRFDDLTSVSIKRKAYRGGNTRGGDRHRLMAHEIRIVCRKDKKHKAELINLSQGGAMIRSGLALDLWEPVTLDFGDGGMLECAVRWVRDDRVGLEFAHETQFGCDPALRDRILLSAIRKSFPQHAARVIDMGQTDEKADRKTRSNSETRIAKRHPLIWSGEIHYEHDTHKVRLRNVSESGALIEAQVSLPVDAGLLLDLGPAGQVFSFVSWSRGGQAGLIFEQPYDISRLAEARPQVTGPSWTAPDYLRKTPHPGSPWADHWTHASLDELGDQLEGFIKR